MNNNNLEERNKSNKQSRSDGFTIGILKVRTTNDDKSDMVTMATNINVTQV